MNGVTRQTIDAAAGGTINNKTPEAAQELIDEMAMNNYQWQSSRVKSSKIAGVHQIDPVTALAAQIAALNQKIDGLNKPNAAPSQVFSCDLCGGSHMSKECQVGNMFAQAEHVDFMGNSSRMQNNPYSSTYNPGWRNHPNFAWGNQSNQPRVPPGFQQPRHKIRSLAWRN